MDRAILDLVERTPFIDTHEHLLEEETRLAGATDSDLFPSDDWSALFNQYLSDDFASAGMAAADLTRFHRPDVPAAEKFRLVAPWWERCRHTGYGRAVRLTLDALYGEDDLTAASAPRIAEKYRAGIRPGFYREIIRERANIEHCQVNSLQRMFMQTAQPDLLRQDISFVEFARCNPSDMAMVEQETGSRATTLEEWLAVIDAYFARHAPSAVAVKNQSAYARRLDYGAVAKESAALAFGQLVAPWRQLGPEGSKTLHDFLFRYCVGKAVEYGLPVKLHTGFYAGRSAMPLSRLSQNASDLCPILQDFPEARFVLMHIGYPYQDEYIALAKHYRNVYIDMCWAWIINPAASVRFLKEFLVAAPANKILTFGGDYIIAENIVGHAAIARRGIATALTELIADGWLAAEEAPSVVERIMRGNAAELFPIPKGARP